MRTLYTQIVNFVHTSSAGASQDEDLVGINEIAEMAGLTKQAVANWRMRNLHFPKPVAVLAAGPVFRFSQVRSWLRKRRVPMAHVFSTINLKGGVGKTTTTVALADFMSGSMNKRVLVIDLDPQTNATVMMIGERRWRKLNAEGRTIARLFQDALDPPNSCFDFEATLQKGVSNVRDADSIDLLPSSLDLIDIQDKLVTVPPGRFYSVNPIELLWRSVKSHLDEYDIVIVDCPPNLGIITLNGLRISNAFLIPTIPDVLSTYGIPQIMTRVRAFSSEIVETIEPLGIVITKYQANSTVHNHTIRRLNSTGNPRVLETIIPQANQFSAAAEYGSNMTLKQKWGYHGLAETYESLTREVLQRLES